MKRLVQLILSIAFATGLYVGMGHAYVIHDVCKWQWWAWIFAASVSGSLYEELQGSRA